MNIKTQQLIAEATRRMARSNDPVHDTAHVRRVVAYAETIMRDYDFTERQQEALLLAAWWHDVAHAMKAKPSVIFMPFIDDTISALFLWYHTIRHRLFGEVAGMSTRLIFCKSLGTGLFTRVFLRKKTRLLLDILTDADKIDLMHIDRTASLRELADTSVFYAYCYRFILWFLLSSSHLQLRTKKAEQLLRQKLVDIESWITDSDVQTWHVNHLGTHRYDRYKKRIATMAHHLHH